MDSYLANIDNYMQQQQQQELLLKRQRQQQQILLQQQQLQQQQQQQQRQQQQQQQQQHQQQQQPQQQQQQMSDEWLRNMSSLTVGASAEPLFPNPAMYMSNTSATTAPSYNNTYSLPPMNQSSNYLQPLQPLQSQQLPPAGYDVNGQPIRIRKKPGRKPNPASPALRKAQNRAAQRAFRERKDRHLKDLETTIRNLREQRNNATRELNAVKANLESYKAESWYLKGVVLTLQFICMHHNIQIPTHSPYLAEDALDKIAQTAPHAIEAYVNSYTKNNTNLKSTMSYHFVNTENDESNERKERQLSTTGSYEDEQDHDEDMDGDEEGEGEEGYYENYNSPPPPPSVKPSVKNEEDNSRLDWLKQLDNTPPAYSPTSPQHQPNQPKQQHEAIPPTSSLDAIQQIRLKLGVQSALNDSDDQAAVSGLKPTILQLAIPHDPRIDLVPTPHMRDRMIIFRDQMDYDRCFTMLLNGAVYHGGDPTMSGSWELPEDFFSEFWYLSIDYDIKKTNKWRRQKGLAEIEPGPQLQSTANSYNDEFFNDEVFDQIVKGMPSLQPMNHQGAGYPLSPPKSQMELSSSQNKDSPKLMYKLMMTAPENRPPVADASLGMYFGYRDGNINGY
jgi:hypothetical protein